MNLVDFLSYVGTFVFAVSGGMKARLYNMDVFGAVIMAFVCSYGGGTIRDILLGIRPGWVNDNVALLLVGVACLVAVTLGRTVSRLNFLMFAIDTIGLGLFAAGGLEKSLSHGTNQVFAVIMGIISATFGGVIADVLGSSVPDLFRRGELYATAALFGGLTYIIFKNLNFSTNSCLISCILAVIFVRILTVYCDVRLPQLTEESR